MDRPLSPLYYLTGVYISSIVLGYIFPFLPVTTSLLVVCGIAGLLWKEGIRITALLLLLFICGFTYTRWSLHVPSHDIAHHATGRDILLRGIIDEPPVSYKDHTKIFLTVQAINKKGKEEPASGRVMVNIFNHQIKPAYGDIVQIRGHLKPIRGFKNPGLFDYGEYMFLKGIHGKINISRPERFKRVGVMRSFLRTIYAWREDMLEAVDRSLPPREGAILRAMVLGSKERLIPEIREVFIRAGVAHILVVSGLHTGFAGIITFLIIRYILIYLPPDVLEILGIHILPSRVAALSIIPVIALYTIISGSRIPVLRAFIMGSIYIICMILERNHSILDIFILSTLIGLLWNPLFLFNISFQYSHIAVFAIIMIGERLKTNAFQSDIKNKSLLSYGLHRLIPFLAITFWVNMCIIPLNSHYFNNLSLSGFIANLIITPYAGFIVLPVNFISVMTCFAGGLHTLPLASLNKYLLIGLINITKWFANLPFALIHIPSLSGYYTAIIYAAMIILYLMRNYRRLILLTLLILLILKTSILFFRHKNTTISFIDVGQGESIFIRFATGETMLIDGGGLFSKDFDTGRSIVAPFLWNKWIYRIDYLVASHPQRDHIKGLTYIVKNFSIGEIWTDGIHTHASIDLDKAINIRGIPVKVINMKTPDKIIGGCMFTFLNPPYSYPPSWTVNDLSIVMRIKCKSYSILLTGDIGKRAIRNMIEKGFNLKSNILKIPHHGSKSAFDREFIMAVHPETGIISSGFMNPYHHPSKFVVHEYELAGTRIYNTAVDGAISIEIADRLKINTYYDYNLHSVDFSTFSSLIHGELLNLYRLGRNLL